MLGFALGFKLSAPMATASHAAPIRELSVKCTSQSVSQLERTNARGDNDQKAAFCLALTRMIFPA